MRIKGAAANSARCHNGERAQHVGCLCPLCGFPTGANTPEWKCVEVEKQCRLVSHGVEVGMGKEESMIKVRGNLCQNGPEVIVRGQSKG